MTFDELGHIEIPLGVSKHPGLCHGAKFLYGLLALYAGKTGKCNPSIDTLARELQTSSPTINRWLGELRRERLIVSRKRGPNRSAQYSFLMHSCLIESMPEAEVQP